MGIFEYLRGPNDKDPDEVQPPLPRVVPAPTSTRVARRRRPRKTCGRSKSSTTRLKPVVTRRNSVNKKVPACGSSS